MITIKEFIDQEKAELKDYFSTHIGSLDIFQVGDNPASNSYIKGKLKDAAELGVKATLYKLPEDADLYDLKSQIADSDGLGKIIQLPLPHATQEDVSGFIDVENDVDGFAEDTLCIPCTPLGIIKYLVATDYEFQGKTALVIGRSEIVGKPIAKLLLDRNCTVIQAHSKTTNLRELVSVADLIVVATGKINTLTCDMIYKPNCYVIDVGINRDENGKLIGDCERDLPVEFQSPVPGGVGLLTRLAIFYNLKTLIGVKERQEAVNKCFKALSDSSFKVFDNSLNSEDEKAVRINELPGYDEFVREPLKFKEDDINDYKIKDLEDKTFTQNSYELDDKYLHDMERASLYDGGLDTLYKKD